MPTDAFPYLPKVFVEIQDGGLRVDPPPQGPKVTIASVLNNATKTIGEIIPVSRGEDLNNLRNADGTYSDAYRGALEARVGGARNLDVIVTRNDYATVSLMDATGVYSALADTYDLLVDHDTEIIVPYGPDVIAIDAAGLSSTQNFGYQLADHCYQATIGEAGRYGVIAVTPPTNTASPTGVPTIAEMQTWVSALNSFDTTAISGDDFTIYDGITDANTDGVPDNYAFWATNDNTIPTGSPPAGDANVEKDAKQNTIDIGAFINVFASTGRFYNALANEIAPTRGYYDGNGCAVYAGLIASLPPHISPLGKVLPGFRVMRNLSRTQANNLARRRFVVVRDKPGVGAVISDAMTGAYNITDYYRSDFTRLTTIRTVLAVVALARSVAEPFLGGPNTGVTREALRSQLESAINSLKGSALEDASIDVTATPAQRRLGQIYVDLELIPALETRTIFVRVAVS